MSTPKMILHLKKIIKDNSKEGMKINMTNKEIEQFRDKRKRQEELEDLKKWMDTKPNNPPAKKKPRKAALSKKINYRVTFPTTGFSEVDDFKTASSTSGEDDSLSYEENSA